MREPAPGRPRPPIGARSIALTAAIVIVTGILCWQLNQHYPLRHWLFVVYVRLWLYAALFAGSSLAIGWRLVRRLVPDTPSLGERAVLALALGTLVFGLGIFVAGLAGLLRGPFFAWPALLLAGAGRDTFRSWRRTARHLRALGGKLFIPRTPLAMAAAALLGLGCLGVYLQVMYPLHLGADTHWYHLPIAERYAAAGRIEPFREGWYLGAYPQLASLLYTWAFLAPGELFVHTQLSSHVEWILFLGTLAGVSVLVRQVLGGPRIQFAAAAVFLFPQVFVYDSSLIVGADHVLAFWAAPLAVTLLRLRDRFDIRRAALAGLLTAAALLTKYQGVYFAAAVAITVSIVAIQRRRPLPALVVLLVCAAASTPHWLKNLVFYGDPLYPLLHRHFPTHPFHEGAASLLEQEYFHPLFTPTGPWRERILQALKAVATFSFVPHDFDSFHGKRPIFGPLFTLSVPLLLFLRPPRRLWWLVVWANLGVCVWYVTSHEDRFLQALVPWMAVSGCAALVLCWRALRWGRLAVAALVALQLVDSADLYFVKAHGMIGDSPIRGVADYLAAGHAGKYDERFRIWGSAQDAAKQFPPGAVVLLHRADHLGLGAVTVTDDTGWQGAIDYLALDSPTMVTHLWRRLGITHFAWYPKNPPGSPDGWAREAVYVRARNAVKTESKEIGPFRVMSMAPVLAEAEPGAPTVIAWLGCGGDPPAGLYSPRGLSKRQPTSLFDEAALAADPAKVLAGANVAVVRHACKGREAVVSAVTRGFVPASEGSELSAYTRP